MLRVGSTNGAVVINDDTAFFERLKLRRAGNVSDILARPAVVSADDEYYLSFGPLFPRFPLPVGQTRELRLINNPRAARHYNRP